MERVCDLHTHSYFSDGTFSPAQLIDMAEAAGLSAIVLSDHNTVVGLPEFVAAAQGRKVEAVPGVEFSTDYHDVELHILGLWIAPQHYETITELMEEMQQRKERSNIALVEALKEAGYELDYDCIKGRTPNGQINRAHIAAALTEQGYTASIKEAFATLLKPRHGYYQPPKRPDSFEIIRFIKSIGAAAVLAHPFLNLKAAELRIFLKEAKNCGLDGMETLYPLYDEETTMIAAEIADEFGLLHSGGSDFHGANKPDIALGTGRGGLTVPSKWMEALRLRAAR